MFRTFWRWIRYYWFFFPIIHLLACQKIGTQKWDIRFHPNNQYLYKTSVTQRFEDWNFALSVRTHAFPIVFDELHLTHLTDLQITGQTRFTFASLATYKDVEQSTSNWILFKDFHFIRPSALRVNKIQVDIIRQGRIVASRSIALHTYEQKNTYQLPLQGCWFVASGHAFGNEHRRWYNQSHFGWDFIRVNNKGWPSIRIPVDLSDYFAFEQPVYAPAAGRVVLAFDNFVDQEPGNPGSPAEANKILIDHGQGEFSKIVHLRQGSLHVKKGDRLQAGQIIARVGSSGLSDAPHLHTHFEKVQFNSEGIITEEIALPIQFSEYTVMSRQGVNTKISQGNPRFGEFVCYKERNR